MMLVSEKKKQSKYAISKGRLKNKSKKRIK